LRAARANRSAARNDLRGAYAPLLPRVGLSVGYTLSQSESQAGFFKYNRNVGLTYGLSASLALFDGFNLHRRIGNARLALRQTEWALDETVNRLDAQVVRAFKRYETNLRISDLEQENLAAARESVAAAMERYRLGGLSALELRDAQVKLLEATDRLFSARYEAKVAETELLRMSGTLLREGP
jgi:outer membrane protein TolC